MRSPRRVVLAVLTVVLLAPAGAAAAPAPPVPLTPSDNAEIPSAVGAVTFTVQGRAHERPGALRIQVDASGESTVDKTGRIRYEGGVPEYKLKQVGTSTNYAVTLSAKTMRRYRNSTVGWLAFRLLPARQCTKLRSGKRDCFQEAKDFRQFDYVKDDAYGYLEPNDTPQTARATKNNYLAYLETAT